MFPKHKAKLSNTSVCTHFWLKHMDSQKGKEEASEWINKYFFIFFIFDGSVMLWVLWRMW